MKNAVDGWLFTSAEDCCETHYQFDIANCRRNSLKSPQWYPTFGSDRLACKNDGLQPLYMLRYAGYLHASQQECCENHYPWNIEGCLDPAYAPDPCEYTYMEKYDKDFLLPEELGYYPVCKCRSSPRCNRLFLLTTPLTCNPRAFLAYSRQG